MGPHTRPLPLASACLQVFMLSSEAEINAELLTRILQRGHSRLPVYEGQDKQVGAAAGWWGRKCTTGQAEQQEPIWHKMAQNGTPPWAAPLPLALPACRTLWGWCL
jgi:hypothetical protein